jgi:Secretion system C-terminal sorting domain
LKDEDMKTILRFLHRNRIIIVVFYPIITIQLLHAQWQLTDFNGGWVTSFATIGTNLFVGTVDNDVFLSTDNGTHWSKADSGLPTYHNDMTDLGAVLAASGTNLFVGTSDSGVYLSTNSGTSWTKVDSGLTNYTVTSLIVSGNNLFAGTFGGGLDFVGAIERWPLVFLSTNNGKSWSEADSGLPMTPMAGTFGITFAVSGANLYAATEGWDLGVYLSTNNGANWTQIQHGMTDTNITALAVLDSNLFVGTYYGLFLSTNRGTSWTQVNTGLGVGTSISALAVSDTRLFAAIEGSALILSYDNGASWYLIDTDMVDSRGLRDDSPCLAVSGTYLFAGAYNVWRRPLSEMDKVNNLKSKKLDEYSLYQNYPNPFNPVTTISFSIQTRSFTSLKIFDITGKEVATIVSEELPAGTYSRQWDATKMSSGVYFYRLQTGSYRSTKKLIVLK